MTTVFPAWDLPSVAVAGSAARFPVRHIYCVGRNYAEHAKEMGGDASKEPPFFAVTAADAAVPVVPPDIADIAYPLGTKSYQHEIAMVVAIGKAGADVSPENANAFIYGYAVGLDMTRRDLQIAAREVKRPWDIGKSFPQSAPIGPIQPVDSVGHPSQGRITLEVNGAVRQQGDLRDLIWDVPHVLHFLSRYWELQPGDLVFTGTPAGVGAVVKGDVLVGRVESLGELHIRIV